MMVRSLAPLALICAAVATGGDFPGTPETYSHRSHNVDLPGVSSPGAAAEGTGSAGVDQNDASRSVGSYQDYSKYMRGYYHGPVPSEQEYIPHEERSASAEAWKDAFVRKWQSGDYVDLPKNSGDPKAWRDAFVRKFGDAYRRYVNAGDKTAMEFPDAPRSAGDCQTLKELDHWHTAQRTLMHSYVPREDQAFAAGALEQEYKDNKARIDGAERRAAEEARAANTTEDAPGVGALLLAEAPAVPREAGAEAAGGRPAAYLRQYAGKYLHLPRNLSDPSAWRDAFVKQYAEAYGRYMNAGDQFSHDSQNVPARAADCTTLRCLREWRAAQHARIDGNIPEGYRSFAAGAAEQEYTDSRARLEQEASEAKAEGKDKVVDELPRTPAGAGPASGPAAEPAMVAERPRQQADVAPRHRQDPSSAPDKAAGATAPGDFLAPVAPAGAAALPLPAPVMVLLGGCTGLGFIAATALISSAHVLGAPRDNDAGTEYLLAAEAPHAAA